jgi:hypothetical protein
MNYRRKALYGDLRRRPGKVFRKLAAQKESRIEEGHLMPCNDDVDGLSSAASSAKVWSQERHGEGDRP